MEHEVDVCGGRDAVNEIGDAGAEALGRMLEKNEALQQLDAQAVLDIERLEFLAIIAVVNTAVCENTVHIQY